VLLQLALPLGRNMLGHLYLDFWKCARIFLRLPLLSRKRLFLNFHSFSF